MLIFYQYPRCSTCVKARKYLENKGVLFKSVHIVDKPPSSSELQKFHEDSRRPLKAFFNTSGQSYRRGGFKDKLATLTHQESYEALARDGKLIKRPLLITPDHILIGFKQTEWDEVFSSIS